MHDESRHYLLTPQDVPRHVTDDHGFVFASNAAMPTQTQVTNYLRNHGIEPTGDRELDAYVVWHEKTHAYGASRTTARRRAEQAPAKGRKQMAKTTVKSKAHVEIEEELLDIKRRIDGVLRRIERTRWGTASEVKRIERAAWQLDGFSE